MELTEACTATSCKTSTIVCMRPVSPLNVGQAFQLASLCSTDTRIYQEELLQTDLTALGGIYTNIQ